MPRFLFQPDPIDGYESNPIPVDMHLGIRKIPTEVFLDEFGINATETMIVGTARKEVVDYLQKHFAMEFRRFSTLKSLQVCYVNMKSNKHGLALENI